MNAGLPAAGRGSVRTHVHPHPVRGPGPLPQAAQQERLISQQVRSHAARSSWCRHRRTHDEQAEKQATDGVRDSDEAGVSRTANPTKTAEMERFTSA